MNRSGGNGALYGLLAVGVLMVAAAGALELMPEGAPDEPPPPPPIAPYLPAPPPEPAPSVEPIPEPPEVLAEPAGPMRTALWHAEIPGETPIACIFGLEVGDEEQLGAAWMRCADGRSFDGPRAAATGMRTLGLLAGVAYQPGLVSVFGTDGDGATVRVVVSGSQHRLSFGETELFVEELSVPDPDGPPAALAAVPQTVVRLAVPFDVTGWLPVSIGVTRGTGRAPRPQDPVCEVTGGPSLTTGYNCRLLLRCRGELVYGLGDTGYDDCTLRDGAIVAAHDDGTTPENSDPRFDLDMDSGRLVVSDVNEDGEPWSATFDMIVDPRLRADVLYTGGYVAEDGTRGSFSIRPFGTPATVTFDGESRALAVTAGDFGAGQYLVQGERQEPLAFGRGGRAIAGHLDGRTVWGFAQRD
ncbi:MAG: hypothetical protein KC619_02795 [Myxococcales bacterium]|nr:hypothetical protein [Myxococcales bacterium]